MSNLNLKKVNIIHVALCFCTNSSNKKGTLLKLILAGI